MKNFKNIKDNNTYSFFINDGGKIPSTQLIVDHDLSKITIPNNSIIFGNKNVSIGNNLSINESGELNYFFNRTLNTNQLFGLFENIKILDNSLPISTLNFINSNKLFGTDGEITIGNNLLLEDNKLILDLPEQNINPGLNTFENPVNISSDGIYFLDTNSFSQFTIDVSVNRAYIINKNTSINFCNGIPIYPNEICLFSFGQKVKTNYTGLFDFDEFSITEQINTEYTGNNIYCVLDSVEDTINNPLINLYSPNSNLDILLVGVNNTPLTLGLNYSVTKTPVDSGMLYAVKFIRGSSTQYLEFGDFDSTGEINLGNPINTGNGLYKIFTRDSDFNNWKLVYTHEINTRKVLLLPQEYNLIITEKYTQFKLEQLEDKIGTRPVYWSTVVAINLYNDGTVSPSSSTVNLWFHEDIKINLTNTNVLTNTPGTYRALYDGALNSVSVDTQINLIIPTKIPELPTRISILNNETTTLNIFNYLEILGEELTITEGLLSNQLIDGFGTVSLAQNGTLTIVPQEFASGEYILEFEFTDKFNEVFNLSVKFKMWNPGYNIASVWRVDVMGAFTDILFNDNIQAFLIGDSKLTSIERLDEFSTGNETIKDYKNISIYDYFFNSTNELKYYAEQEALDSYFTSSLRATNSLELIDIECSSEYSCFPVSSYKFTFNENITLNSLEIIPSKNIFGYILEPKQYAIWKSLDNGNTWVLYESNTISRSTNDNTWNKYLYLKYLEFEQKYNQAFPLIS